LIENIGVTEKMKETKKIKRIKENITQVEFKKLMASVRGSESLRVNTKSNLLRTFVLLYYTGMRLNELQDLRVKDIKELLDIGTVKVFLKKTSSERKLYVTKDFKKQLEKLFDLMKKIADKLFNIGLASDDRKNRVVFHRLRHTYCSLLAINHVQISSRCICILIL